MDFVAAQPPMLRISPPAVRSLRPPIDISVSTNLRFGSVQSHYPGQPRPLGRLFFHLDHINDTPFEAGFFSATNKEDSWMGLRSLIGLYPSNLFEIILKLVFALPGPARHRKRVFSRPVANHFHRVCIFWFLLGMVSDCSEPLSGPTSISCWFYFSVFTTSKNAAFFGASFPPGKNKPPSYGKAFQSNFPMKPVWRFLFSI
jgi:hypothetical protein